MDILLPLTIVGTGAMGGAILTRVVQSGVAEPDKVIAVDIDGDRVREIAARTGVRFDTDTAAAVADSRIVIMAVKPQAAMTALAIVADNIDDRTVLVSIIAGWTIKRLQDALKGHGKIIRCMPNTPALIGKGITALCNTGDIDDSERQSVKRIFQAVGDVVELDESYFDAVTALSGSGPAYVYTFIEGLIDAGVRQGLPRPLARKLVLDTVSGSAAMVAEGGRHPAELRDMVTSPGGTTIAGMAAMEKAGIRTALFNAVSAAADRSAELGK